ncbi:MAG: tetratricopeptide repeat protein [Pseudomonadota bacterium]
MTDIFSEIEEDIRKDRAKRLWDRFGKFIIAGALALVLAVAAWRGWEAYRANQAAQAGDAFLDAVALIEAEPERGIAELEAIVEDGPAGYAALARFRTASAQAERGAIEDALTTMRALTTDNSVDPLLRDVAKVRLGYLLLDHGDPTEIEGLLIDLSDTTSPFSHSAREIRAFAALKAGNRDQAQALFVELLGDSQSPEPVRSRARVALDVLASDGAATAGS